MAAVTEKKSEGEIRSLYEKLKPFAKKESRPAWTHWQLKMEDYTVTAYTSGKVVWQGGDLDWLEAAEPSPASEFPQAGSDEVGTGDYFGPVVVASCLVSPDMAAPLQKLGITDSKKMTDEAIRKAAPFIAAHCPHSILVVMPDKYNQVHAAHNIVDMKCRLHNQAWLNLQNKGVSLPALSVVDQFVAEKSYYRYLADVPAYKPLRFETKAESRYLAVAAASVLARARFLEVWDQMEARWDMKLAKGAGAPADGSARQFVQKYGRDKLGLVAKLHFKNTDKL